MTKELIASLITEINSVLPTTYERAPVGNTYPYAVLNSLSISCPNEDEKQAFFYIDLYTDENSGDTESAAVCLADKCDEIMALNGKVVAAELMYIKIEMTQQKDIADTETDLVHRQISGNAKIFILGG